MRDGEMTVVATLYLYIVLVDINIDRAMVRCAVRRRRVVTGSVGRHVKRVGPCDQSDAASYGFDVVVEAS